MDLTKARKALKQYFGYDAFRPMQADIVQHVYDGKDGLVLMPTGGGKSMCFQIPAVTMEGTAVVVSPLISLMKDQVEGLQANGIQAAYLNSSLTGEEQREVEDAFFNSDLDLLYVSPERVCSSSFIPLLQRAKVSLFAIDEAHCVSSWGHDFRPEYRKLRFLKKQFPQIPILALTATADRVTRADILKQLNLPTGKTFLASFDRPNLSLEVRPGQKKKEQIVRFIKQRPNQSGIIYCLSRKSTENLADSLNAVGIKAKAYHAKLPREERSQVQEDFIKDESPVICATIAFGMGIDKSNIRWVIHFNLPKNLENYYQEIGRAGRDSAPADTLLFYSFHDVMLLTEIIGNNKSENMEIQLTKLDRMRQYAESVACRRRMLLNYFNENLTENCGNCDICKNPPTAFDGTVLAQKALSAVYRLKEKVGMGMLIDVLRGSGRREIAEKGYDQIKTFGAGRDLPTPTWQNYLYQLLNLGYLDIAYDEYGAIKLTPASRRVLFEKEPVELVRLATLKERQAKDKAKATKKSKGERVRDDLFEKLRVLRRSLAQRRGVPPYQIFHDSTLEEMAAAKPITDAEMKQISGVGERKLHLYGNDFIDEILDFISQKENTPQGDSYRVSHALFSKGNDVNAIAEKRNMSPTTIVSHLAASYRAGAEIDIHQFATKKEIKSIAKAVSLMEEPITMKEIFMFFDEKIPYATIRMVLVHLDRLGVYSNQL